MASLFSIGLRSWTGRLPVRLLVLMLLLTRPAAAAVAPDSTTQATIRVLPADNNPALRLRQPDAERLRELRGQRDFRYVEVKSELSAWDMLWLRFWRWLAELLATPSGKFIWQYGIYAFLVVALVFVVLKLMQVDLTRAFGRAPRRAALSYDAETEDLHALDLDVLLTQAEEARNYRLAVRLGYLRVLRQLSDKGLIKWQPDKTNHDYLYELPTGPLPESFRELTRQFEYVWYGEQDDLTADDYERARTTRQAFERRLSSTSQAA
ncbi:DUF4129 domain-containing protein [Hymenobacter perfusus]|uniref:DUF4129 domain-containing protein n=1 Tax=Hymenobacter perfusus TaxID=1236770 RepID=A0A428KGQ4_9BACT|nr:DUF4129 domain-containing protein [Hymenobacter perfusus]RSK45657.1 DUF4129 domain-containing protein [Hymenobacter perfusus]